MAARIAVVTGASKGIGFEICRQLGQKGVNVVLTARDPGRGQEAVSSLQQEGLNIIFHALDVTAPQQVRKLADYMEGSHGRCDILVNNAGILADKRGASVLDVSPETMCATLEANLYAPLRISQALVPLMRKHRYGRIVNLSSGLGQLEGMDDGTPAYRVSKAALNALTCMFAAAGKDSGILVNSMCPGWVRTDMGGANATRSVEQGAETAVWLATLPDDGPTGGFFRDRKAIAW
jgi:NAD(P)-dependent dehydrogenase (short-subunit alcohol dehydrogenase family)